MRGRQGHHHGPERGADEKEKKKGRSKRKISMAPREGLTEEATVANG